MTESVRPYYSNLANHSLHTLPLILNLIEAIYVNHSNIHFSDLTKHILTLSFFVTFWQYSIFHITGEWTYPFLPPLWDSLPYGLGYWMFAAGSSVLLRSITKFFFGLNCTFYLKRESQVKKKKL